MKRDRGYFLTLVLVFAGVAAAAISGLVSFANANIISGRKAVNSEQALQLAEAGVEYYRWHLSHAPTDYSDGGGAFPHIHNVYNDSGVLIGTYALTVTAPSASSSAIIIKSVGVPSTDQTIKRTIEAKYLTGDGVAFHYGVQAGTGGFVMGNNSTINGNIYSNSDIVGGNGSTVTGTASAVGTITNVNAGQSNTGVVAAAFPVTNEMISGWKDDADASVFIGTKTISGTNNTLGPLKIQGNLVLDNGASLTVANTIWVTGTISLGNGATITLAPSYGSSNGVIIADGTISFGNSVNLGGSGTSGSNIMIMSLSNSSNAVSLGNGNTSSLILYAPNGGISIGNGATLIALGAKTINLGNGVEINYSQGLISPTFTSGPSGGFELSGWDEVR